MVAMKWQNGRNVMFVSRLRFQCVFSSCLWCFLAHSQTRHVPNVYILCVFYLIMYFRFSIFREEEKMSTYYPVKFKALQIKTDCQPTTATEDPKQKQHMSFPNKSSSSTGFPNLASHDWQSIHHYPQTSTWCQIPKTCRTLSAKIQHNNVLI